MLDDGLQGVNRLGLVYNGSVLIDSTGSQDDEPGEYGSHEEKCHQGDMSIKPRAETSHHLCMR
jgi:hypothetical protein